MGFLANAEFPCEGYHWKLTVQLFSEELDRTNHSNRKVLIIRRLLKSIQ